MSADETIQHLRQVNEKLKQALDGDASAAIQQAYSDGEQYGRTCARGQAQRDLEADQELKQLQRLLDGDIGPEGSLIREPRLQGRTVTDQVVHLLDRYRRSLRRAQELEAELEMLRSRSAAVDR